jgi:hypothetical protein
MGKGQAVLIRRNATTAAISKLSDGDPVTSGTFRIRALSDYSVPFLRTYCRDCDGALTGPPADTQLDGATAYVPSGTVESCGGGSGSEPERVIPQVFQHQELLCETLPSEMVIGGDFPDADWLVADGGAWTRSSATAGWTSVAGPDGVPGFIDFSAGAIADGATIQQIVDVVPGQEYTFSMRFGSWIAGATNGPAGRVQVFSGGGAVLYDSGTVNLPAGSSGPVWPAAGVIGPVPVTATDDTIRILITDLSVENLGQMDLIADNVSLLSDEPRRVPFIRKYVQSLAGNVTSVLNFDLDGAPYDPQGEVGLC